MQGVATAGGLSEPEFAAFVDVLAADPDRRELLTKLLPEDHPFYDQRGTATVVRMRGWVLLALSRSELSESGLLFVLEELDTGGDAYLVAAAGRALRSYPKPTSVLAPFVMHALTNIRYHDQPVSFEGYGEYAVSSDGTSAVRELLATLAWLGPHAASVLPELEALRRPSPGGLSKKSWVDVDRAIKSIRGDRIDDGSGDQCCALPTLGNKFSWLPGVRPSSGPIEQTVFEDQDATSITYKELFSGHPSIVAFFYTRCDNPLKCSLTVTKLARVQKLLEERGMAESIHTAAITYDPGFDLPQRLSRYGRGRGLRLDARHRMLRATDGIETLRRHFRLGVNFVGSLVNRHRIEVYVLDARGRIAASFERLHWDEKQVVECAAEVLAEKRRTVSPILGTLASLGVAFFPKCPLCWAGYMSLFGIGAVQRIPYSPWLQTLLVAMMLVNLASTWLRGRAIANMNGFYLVSMGALTILLSKIVPEWEDGAIWGVLCTLAGSLLSALGGRKRHAMTYVQ